MCSILYVKVRSNIETSNATTDTRCTEPDSGSSPTPCDRLSRNKQDQDLVLYRKIIESGSGNPTRRSFTFKNEIVCDFVAYRNHPPRHLDYRTSSSKGQSKEFGRVFLPVSSRRLPRFLSWSSSFQALQLKFLLQVVSYRERQIKMVRCSLRNREIF